MAMGFYLALVLIFGFVVFIIWAKSAVGQQSLKQSWGESHSFKKKRRMARRHSGTNAGSSHPPRPHR